MKKQGRKTWGMSELDWGLQYEMPAVNVFSRRKTRLCFIWPQILTRIEIGTIVEEHKILGSTLA